jgi:hypothetical protein
MAPQGFIAATLDYPFDYGRMAAEIEACREFFVYTPPYTGQVEGGLSGRIPFMSESVDNYRRIDVFEGGVAPRPLRGASIFYLRNSNEGDVVRRSPYGFSKGLSHRSWYWRPELRERIGYTIECIESLPYRTIGVVRTFVCEDTFMPTHRDVQPAADGSYDKSKAIGISLVPATGGVGMLIWNAAARRVEEVRANCLVFDDSVWHGVPMTKGLRITIRIFGELDFDRLAGRTTASLLAA